MHIEHSVSRPNGKQDSHSLNPSCITNVLVQNVYLHYSTLNHKFQALPDGRRPFSYNHLLFNPTLVRLPPAEPGEVGSEKRLAEELAANGLVDPKEDLLPLPKLLTLFWKRGLPNGEPAAPCTRGLPRPERGELP